MTVRPDDDFPHPVPPQAFMTWKENWVFPALDTERRVASLFHFSLRPGAGEGIFTAKFAIDGDEHRYVGRGPVPADLATLRPVADERIRFEVVEPGREFHIAYRSPELDADVRYTARFPPWDFEDGPRAPGPSDLGEIGRSVFPFHHYEQALRHEGRLVFKEGERAGTELEISGYANRDHSWGWREDLSFREHHWICASFEDRFVGGSAMEEDHYRDGLKHGGWISTTDGNDGVRAVDVAGAYWLAPNEPLPVLDRDVRYRIETVGGDVATVVAHISRDYGRLYLDARSADRSRIYQDVQIFCDFTLAETGQRGSGVLEVGKRGEGDGVADRWKRSASRAGR
jgi:hypothetical protein